MSADAAGSWSVDVELRRGRNQFDISALDPETGKTVRDTPRACSSRCRSSSSRRRRSTVDSPAEGAQFENGAIPVKGTTTNATTVAVTAILHRRRRRRAGDQPPRPSGAGRARPTSGRRPSTSTRDGTFDSPLDLSAGKWQIVVTATSAGGQDGRP